MECGCHSEILQRNRLQGVNAIQEEHPDGGDVAGDLSDALKEFQTDSFTPRGYLLMKESPRNAYGKTRLGNPGLRTFLGQCMQVLDAAVEHVYRMNDPKPTDFRHIHFNGATC